MPGLGGIRGRHLFLIDLVVIGLAIVGAMLLRFDTLRFAEDALIYFPAALFPLHRPAADQRLGRALFAGLGVRERRRALADRARRRCWFDRRAGRLLRRARAAWRRGHRHAGRPVPPVLLRPRGPADPRRHGRRTVPDPSIDGVAGLAARRSGPAAARKRRRNRRACPDPGLRRRRHRRDRAADDRCRIAMGSACGSSACSTTTARKRNQVLRGQKVRRRPRRPRGHRPSHRRPPPAHRHPDRLPGDVVRRAVEEATRLGLETRTVPSLDELVSGRLGAAAIREVEVD